MDIVITGANGAVGTALIRYFSPAFIYQALGEHSHMISYTCYKLIAGINHYLQ